MQADVDNYQHFVPWCRKSVVTKRSDDGHKIEAELEVGFQLFVERYACRGCKHFVLGASFQG